MSVIEMHNVQKVYKPRPPSRTLFRKGGVADLVRRTRSRPVEALRDVSFAVERGEALGIIGANGSGKTTLLKILAGVTVPTLGEVIVKGRVVTLLELGAGFHPLLTGRENSYLNARLLGMSRAQWEAAFEDIIEFSGLRRFIDYPLNTYSSGMVLRLGFAVAVHADPDIFLIDEVLAVGDEEFQRKCRGRIAEFKERGKTLVFVSHDLNLVGMLCDRVILLSQGSMVCRPTPQETIEFYLRQVGRPEGVLTLSGAGAEVVFNNGRLALFLDKRESTASAGMRVEISCREQWHSSVSGDWEVIERREDGCRCEGRLHHLPVRHHWDLRLVRGRHASPSLVWRIAIECDREAPISSIQACLPFPAHYSHWIYGDSSGAFPDILPSDREWSLVVPPEAGCLETAASCSEEDRGPPVAVSLESQWPYASLHWANTDYATADRVLVAGARIPEADSPLPPGRYELMTLRICPGASLEEVRDRARQRREAATITHCGLAARFTRGTIRLSSGGQELSAYLHLYGSLLMGELWNDSVALKWEMPRRTGNGLEVSGQSRRFPFQLHWQLSPANEGLNLTIWVEALEPLEIQEYHVSIALRSEYDRWQTDHESGLFPPFQSGSTDWTHANRTYAPGTFITAFAASLPAVTLKGAAHDIPLRMTALNTGYHEGARVIQALCVPERGPLRLAKGRHLVFCGTVAVAAAEHKEDSIPPECSPKRASKDSVKGVDTP